MHRLKDGGCGGISDNRAIFEVRVDKGNIELDDGREGRSEKSNVERRGQEFCELYSRQQKYKETSRRRMAIEHHVYSGKRKHTQ